MVAREQAVDPAADRQVERAQQRVRQRPRARAGRACGPVRARAARVTRQLPPREVELGRRHRLEHAVEDRVGVDLLGERLVAEHEAVAEHVLRERVDVLRRAT